MSAIEGKVIKVRLTFVRSVLGSQPADEDIYRRFIGTKAPNPTKVEDEVKALGVDGFIEKGKTIFPKMADGTPFVYDYQIRGFFKGAGSALRKVDGSLTKKTQAYRKEVDQLIMVEPECIPFRNYGEIGECQRPLRAQTAQGERVSLAISEKIEAGAQLEFSIRLLNGDKDRPLLEEWLDYGIYNGIGQWRNSGKGQFTWEEICD